MARLTPALDATPADTEVPVVQNSTTAVASEEAEEAEVVDDFGMNPELARKAPDKKADDSLTELTAVVVALRKRPYGEQVVTLENGQVWAQTRAESGLLVREGDTVIIRQGLFGSYQMTGRGKRSFAVERIE